MIHSVHHVSRQINDRWMRRLWFPFERRLVSDWHVQDSLQSTAPWIGGTLTCESTGIRASVKESIISDICDDLRGISRNITAKKELHSLVGKLGHAAGLLIIMRPFLEPPWAALYWKAHGGSRGFPRSSIWAEQISASLDWFSAFS